MCSARLQEQRETIAGGRRPARCRGRKGLSLFGCTQLHGSPSGDLNRPALVEDRSERGRLDIIIEPPVLTLGYAILGGRTRLRPPGPCQSRGRSSPELEAR